MLVVDVELFGSKMLGVEEVLVGAVFVGELVLVWFEVLDVVLVCPEFD